jgi:Dock homology region 2
MQGTAQTSSRVAHYEAVEDALLEAANVFSPTELPEHRVAWLRMLAQFHSSRQKHAEEAACRYLIHVTLRLAARLHGSLWSNTPFLPWTDDIPDPIVYIDAEAGQTGDIDYHSDVDGSDWDSGSQIGCTNSFRRIFYRVATSVRDHNLVWDTGINKNLFFGVTFAPEYTSVNPWLTLREMEESMVEEVEAAGALFLRAGIVESSRYAWGRAAEYHTEKFNFGKLAMVYEQLSGAIVSKVSPIDTSLPQEVSTTFGRFYRVWLHGEAPDELRGIEFVYRSKYASCSCFTLSYVPRFQAPRACRNLEKKLAASLSQLCRR